MGEYDALLIGALPHDWLFPYLRAVIHHGGAGILFT
jgi:UDP:flavonoid glycosyltransferase YjiC (YdhE family)